MSIVSSPLLLGASVGSSYQVARSLRFNAADTSTLSRSFTLPSSTRKLTISLWTKRTTYSGSANLLSTTGNFGCISFYLGYNGNGYLSFITTDSTTGNQLCLVSSAAVLLDSTAWYHIVVSADTTQSIDANRVKLYINGQQITSFSGTTIYPALNDYLLFTATDISSGTFNGYLAETYYIDGQGLAPSSFAQTDATTGQWVPKAYSGTYGSAGFQLLFADNSNTTATTLGKDTSGNGNNFTPNNFSVTAGVGNDSLVDTPTSYGTDTSVGGEVRGNYAILNQLSPLTTVTLANGNLDYSSTTVGQSAVATIGMSSGKWYWEVVTTGGTTQTQVGVYSTSASTLYSLAANNTVYGVRFDAGAGTLDYTTNGTTWTSIATGLTTGPYFPYFYNNGTTSKTVSINFGQRPFSYVASGYKSLCDTNLTAPTITKPNTVVDVVTYTGTGASLTPTSTLAFNPDLVWIKSRSDATDHALYDVVRGTTIDLVSNSIAAETTQVQGVTAFNSGGFTVGTLAKINTNASTYVAWCWDAGSSTVTNTQGSITSTVRANASAGFSITTYTGTGANATVGHGLSVAPELVIVKQRDGSNGWAVWHTAIANTQYLLLSSTAAVATGTTFWNSTSPTSSVFSVGTAGNTNGSGGSHVAYCFNSVAGCSASFSYTGNGSAAGPFIYLGFRAKVLLIKRTSTTGNWYLWDTVRNTFNILGEELYPNAGASASTASDLNILSNGISISSSAAGFNANGSSYVGFAWAESPFKYSRAR